MFTDFFYGHLAYRNGHDLDNTASYLWQQGRWSAHIQYNNGYVG